MRHILSRRNFIRGLGLGVGAGMLMPLMRQVWAEQQGITARRFVFVIAGNGIETKTLVSPAVRQAINDAGGNLTEDRRNLYSSTYKHTSALEIAAPDLGAAYALAPLKEGGADLTGKSTLMLGLSSLVAGGGHTTGYGALSSSKSGGQVPVAPTIDAWLAAQEGVRQQTPFDVLRVGIVQSQGARLNYGLTAIDARKPAPLIVNPTLAYNSVFGSVADAAGMRQFRSRSELLDLARGDVQRALAALPGSSPERAKLESYLASVEDLRARQERLLGAEDHLRALDPGGPSAHPAYDDPCPLVRLETQFDLTTSALMGGLTNVAVIGSGPNGASQSMVYESLDDIYRQDSNYRGAVDRHTVCHESKDNAAFLAVQHAATRRHVEMIAKMARALDAAPEGGGTMLDHTAIVFMSDNGDEHHSTSREWPLLVVGGSKLGLKTDGRAVVYPAYDEDHNRQLSNLFNTMGYAAGVELDEFGQEGAARKAQGPLSELFG